jgi:hypothetical protein
VILAFALFDRQVVDACDAQARFWHKADIPITISDVRYWGKADIEWTCFDVCF